MLSAEILKKISETRLKEAKTLFQNHFYDGAKYLLGYSLETAFKVVICKILNSNYPESKDVKSAFFTHNFDTLLLLSGLEKELDRQKRINRKFATNWSIITTDESTAWRETLRYEEIGTATESDLITLFDALENQTNGILPWLKNNW